MVALYPIHKEAEDDRDDPERKKPKRKLALGLSIHRVPEPLAKPRCELPAKSQHAEQSVDNADPDDELADPGAHEISSRPTLMRAPFAGGPAIFDQGVTARRVSAAQVTGNPESITRIRT